jgi:hypothetical protein
VKSQKGRVKYQRLEDIQRRSPNSPVNILAYVKRSEKGLLELSYVLRYEQEGGKSEPLRDSVERQEGNNSAIYSRLNTPYV